MNNEIKRPTTKQEEGPVGRSQGSRDISVGMATREIEMDPKFQ